MCCIFHFRQSADLALAAAHCFLSFLNSTECTIVFGFSHTLLSTMGTKYTVTEGPYTLKQLVSKVKLPQVILVTQGFYGGTDRDTVSSGQVMVAFFVKRVKGVTGIHNKRSFHIPLNSAMQFAPVPSEGMYCTPIQHDATILLHYVAAK